MIQHQRRKCDNPTVTPYKKIVVVKNDQNAEYAEQTYNSEVKN